MAHPRLLDIAVREFGGRGLDGASTRGIAAAAGTVMSSITYHYGGKEGLYLAAADHVATQMAAALGDVLAEAREGGDDAEGARAGIHRLLARMAEVMLSGRSDDWTLFILREQMRPTAAFDRLYDGAMGDLARTLAALVRVATGGADPRAAQVATITLIGQVTTLRSGRATCLRLLGHDALTDRDAADLTGRIAANIDAILDRLRAEQQGTA